MIAVWQTLDNEVKKLKGHVKLLLDKTATDDALIDAMRAEMQTMRQKFVKVSLAATAQLATSQSPSSPGYEPSEFESRTIKQTIDHVCAE